MAPSRVVGGLTQSSAISGIFFQGDGQSQNVINCYLGSSFGNTSNSIPGSVCSSLGPVSGDINQTVLNSVATSAHSVGASSLVTDANSAFPGGPQLQRSASVNNESCMRLPASPMSFTSNNISVSGSSIIDGSSIVQHNPHHDPTSQNGNQSQQHLQHGSMSITSLPASQTGQVSLPMASRIPNSFVQDPGSLSQVQKKPRLDGKQDNIVQQQVIQQLLQRQDSMQSQSHNPQLQAFIQQQQRLRHQQQLLQAMPQLQRVQLQQHQQLQQHLQQQNVQQMAVMKHPFDTGGICARRLMQYLFHQRRPAENTITYWRSFVKEYYAPRAKKRWCLSLYENVVHHAFGVFPQASMDAWHCDICRSNSGRGFEATYEVLPRLNEIKFSSGVIDELLFLGMPSERRLVSGIMMLEYQKAVQESVYEHVRVVREGHLRIIFTHDLKILSWEFCARRHEELLPRRLVASQVNQLLQVAQKCQNTINESGSEGVLAQDLQSNSSMVVTAGRQLAKSLELQSLNDLGFSKRYVRCLQIADVVNSMKDLIDFCWESKADGAGPIEGLKNYPQQASSTPKLQLPKTQEMEQLTSIQSLPTGRNTLNKLMALHPEINNHVANNNNPLSIAGRGALSGPAAAALALTNYQSMLVRQSSINSNPSSLHQEASTSLNNSHPSPSPSSSFHGSTIVSNGPMQSGPFGGFLGTQLGSQHQQQQQQQQHQHQHQHAMRTNGILLSNQLSHQQPPQGSQALQQQMTQQLLQEMSNNHNGARAPPVQQQKDLPGQNGLGSFGNTRIPPTAGSPASAAAASASSNMAGGGVGGGGPALSKNNSFKIASNSDCSAAGVANSGFNAKVSAASDVSQSLHAADGMLQETTNDFPDNEFFSSELGDTLEYWKA